MWNQIIQLVGGIFKPAADLVDNLHTSEEEKLLLKNKLQDIKNEVTQKQLELLGKQMDLERQLVDAQTAIITTETKSDSWISRNWRPITMLTFIAIIVCHSLGWITLEEKFADKFMLLVQIGLGGYVVGRSAEKAAPAIANAIKKRS